MNELRAVDGGTSKYVYCPICGYKSKPKLLERLFWSNARKEGYLIADHGYLRNIFNLSRSVHSR